MRYSKAAHSVKSREINEIKGDTGTRPWKVKVTKQRILKHSNSVVQEPEGLSPHSQQPATGSYPEPAESNPHPQASLSNIHSDPILPSTPWSSERSLSFGLSHRNLAQFSLLSHACHMPCLPRSHWLDLPNDIWWCVQIMKLLKRTVMIFIYEQTVQSNTSTLSSGSYVLT
jgi:hypothetical protein